MEAMEWPETTKAKLNQSTKIIYDVEGQMRVKFRKNTYPFVNAKGQVRKQ